MEQRVAQSAKRIRCTACDDPSTGFFDGLPYCNKHWLRLYNHGTTELVGKKNTNVFTVDGDRLTITTKHGTAIFADADDYEILSKHSWCVSKGYAVASVNKRTKRMHRFILTEKLGDGDVVDHANGNPLDNRKSNLRICKPVDNGKNLAIKKTNTSGATGIRQTKHGTYHARIMVDGIEINLGCHQTHETAVKARIKAEQEHFGEFAPSLRNATEKRKET